jgi:hypothetical protein
MYDKSGARDRGDFKPGSSSDFGRLCPRGQYDIIRPKNLVSHDNRGPVIVNADLRLYATQKPGTCIFQFPFAYRADEDRFDMAVFRSV